MTKHLSGNRAAWLGLLGTPVLVVAAVLLAGVTAGSAGPQTAVAGEAAAASTDTGIIVRQSTQPLAEVKAYWTAERMATAVPMPLLGRDQGAGDPGPQQVGGPSTVALAMQRADGTVETQTAPAAGGATLLTEPYHEAIPFSRWQWFGRYVKNAATGANVAISPVAKMFFTQYGTNYVCSASAIGVDGVWTAGHCVHAGDNLVSGWSSNVLVCPSYDSTQGGVNPAVGCWGATSLVTRTAWYQTGDGDIDMGAIEPSDTGTLHATQIGNVTSWYGMAYAATDTTGAYNLHWMALGYPAAAPFSGGSINVCASSLGYVDEWTAGGSYNSVAMGCDMTGGSSGGPWVFQFGRPGQPGGLNGRYVNGHNDWRHNAEPGELNSPFFNCAAVALYNSVNDTSIVCP